MNAHTHTQKRSMTPFSTWDSHVFVFFFSHIKVSNLRVSVHQMWITLWTKASFLIKKQEVETTNFIFLVCFLSFIFESGSAPPLPRFWQPGSGTFAGNALLRTASTRHDGGGSLTKSSNSAGRRGSLLWALGCGWDTSPVREPSHKQTRNDRKGRSYAECLYSSVFNHALLLHRRRPGEGDLTTRLNLTHASELCEHLVVNTTGFICHLLFVFLFFLHTKHWMLIERF